MVHYAWGPVLISALFAYLTAHCFIAVYQMAIGMFLQSIKFIWFIGREWILEINELII